MVNGFTEVAKVGEILIGAMKLVQVEYEMIIVANVEGNLYAFSDTCTHAECALSEGSLSGDLVECGCHGSQFNVKTGAVESGPAIEPVPTYAVRVEGGRVLVGPA